MKTVYHKANSRGHANHGWLDSHHTFSFAGYFDPDRIQFGALRVLNDDKVAPGMGFDTHPHNNMEIISIPLYGDLEHRDSMGNVTVIREGDIQVMSAGTGVFHSEYNKNKDKEVHFLQIWVFPNKQNVEPRYDQISIRNVQTVNTFYQILSPKAEDQGVWIHQDAWFYMADLETGINEEYHLRGSSHGVYIFLLEGGIQIGAQYMETRDGMGIWETKSIKIQSKKPSKILLMEIPMAT